MNHLKVDADQAFNTSHVVSSDAMELRDELAGLQRDWENLIHCWSGSAAAAYAEIWADWHKGAMTLVETLADLSHNLGLAAVQYSEQDAQSASGIDTVQF